MGDFGSACHRGDLRLVRSLLAAGVDVDALCELEDFRGSTWEDSPLGWALDNDKLEVLEFLLTCGADANRLAAHGTAPVHLAAQMGNLIAVQTLVAFGANLTLRSRATSGCRAALDWTLGVDPSYDGPREKRDAVAAWIRKRLFCE